MKEEGKQKKMLIVFFVVQFIIIILLRNEPHAHTSATVCIHTNFPATCFNGRPPSSGSNLCSVQPRDTTMYVKSCCK